MSDIKRWMEKNKSLVSIGSICCVVVIGCILLGVLSREENSQQEVLETRTSEITETSSKDTSINSTMYVDVKGAVKQPGMYEVTSDMRVLNVIDMAGGFLEEADANQINYAEKLDDQMVIYVPRKGEKVDDVAIADKRDQKTQNDKSETAQVNINNATKEELMTLNGVGEKKAEKIIEYREDNGSFKTTEDIKNVSGFGEKTYSKLQH
ncbi:MAG: helix-hairpin-helix domain-containing protein [Vagococcus sp.]